MIVNGYATLDEFRDWVPVLDDSQDDLNLERAITAVSRGIDHYTQRHFYQAAGPRVFDACWTIDDYTGQRVQTVEFGAFNDLVSITSLKTDDNRDGTFETTWAAADYQLLPLNPAAAPQQRPYRRLRATGTRIFPAVAGTGRVGLVEITGTWGWPAVPEDVKQACLIRTHAVFKRRETPQGVAGFGEFGIVRITRQQDPDVAALLDPYQIGVVA